MDAPTQQERDAAIQDISDTFEKYRDSDFGRKLYLIQNSIYGVDIQPVATQIAKLRFFISLAIEQTPDNDAPNYGIRPLPNLETRFVAANTLLGLERPEQLTLGQTDAVQDIQRSLDRKPRTALPRQHPRTQEQLPRRGRPASQGIVQGVAESGLFGGRRPQDSGLGPLRPKRQRRLVRP